MLTAREAMQQAIERAQMGEFDGARVFLDIARELRLGARPVVGPSFIVEEDVTTGLPDQIYGYQRGQIPGPTEMAVELARSRLEFIGRGAVVMTDERSLLEEIIGRAGGYAVPDDTPSIPVGVAHPEPGSVGETSTCLNCTYPVRWMRGPGWVHDRDHYPAPCAPAFT